MCRHRKSLAAIQVQMEVMLCQEQSLLEGPLCDGDFACMKFIWTHST